MLQGVKKNLICKSHNNINLSIWNAYVEFDLNVFELLELCEFIIENFLPAAGTLLAGDLICR